MLFASLVLPSHFCFNERDSINHTFCVLKISVMPSQSRLGHQDSRHKPKMGSDGKIIKIKEMYRIGLRLEADKGPILFEKKLINKIVEKSQNSSLILIQ